MDNSEAVDMENGFLIPQQLSKPFKLEKTLLDSEDNYEQFYLCDKESSKMEILKHESIEILKKCQIPSEFFDQFYKSSKNPDKSCFPYLTLSFKPLYLFIL